MVSLFKKDVVVTREYEFYQGYVRVKISVQNKSNHVINDVSLDFKYDHNIFTLDISKNNLDGDKLSLGSVYPNTSSTCSLLFDPLICSSNSEIKCLIAYADSKGNLKSVQMKPLSIKVTCPLMKTDNDVNTGILKELIDKLDFKESRVYSVQGDIKDDRLSNLLREILQRHDVRHVRTFRKDDGSQTEVWFYGSTKIHPSKVILRTSIHNHRKEAQYIELFVATEKPEYLVGLLAEMGSELMKCIQSSLKTKQTVNQTWNIEIIDSVITRPTLIFGCEENRCVEGIQPVVTTTPTASNGNDAKMNLTYEDVFVYLKELQKSLQMKSDILKVDLHVKEEREKLFLEEGVLTSYKKTLNKCGFPKVLQGYVTKLDKILNQINEDTTPIFLSALVVNEKKWIPGDGYFIEWHDSKDLSEKEKIELWIEDLKAIARG
jgi:hypothetical protein